MTPAEIAERGKQIYKAELRTTLEPEHCGQFVVIDVLSGGYVVADDELYLARTLRARRPNALPSTVRIGYRAVGKVGRRGRLLYEARRLKMDKSDNGVREYEGTWEEITAHAAELAGRRVHVTVLPRAEDAEGSSKAIIYPSGPSTARTALRHAGTWDGDDLEECLELVYATRSKARI